jgi:formate-dependent nitrite reductase membrane component NrfD
MVVVYLFVGGLGGGSLVLSGLAHLSRKLHLRGIARAGAIIAPLLVAGGTGLLVFDLGRPLFAWRLFVAFEPVSPMWIGSWLLTLFIIVGLVYAALYLPPEWAESLARRVKKLRQASMLLGRLASWNRQTVTDQECTFPDSPTMVRLLRDGLALIGIPLGAGVGIYTGVLLGAIPARPFWNTPMVAQLFLFSALSTAVALLFLLAPRMDGNSGEERRRGYHALLAADLVFIVIELFMIIPFVIHAQLSTSSARVALDLILGGSYTTVFWIGVVLLGILVPLAFEVSELLGWLNRLPESIVRVGHAVVPVLILVGGYLLRWVFVHAGQDSYFL